MRHQRQDGCGCGAWTCKRCPIHVRPLTTRSPRYQVTMDGKKFVGVDRIPKCKAIREGGR